MAPCAPADQLASTRTRSSPILIRRDQTTPGRDMIRQILLCCLGPLLAAATADAAGVELPIRKAGLWEIKMTRTGSPVPAMTMQHCTDASTDRAMNGMASPMAQQMCSKQDIRKTATGYASDTVCNVAGRTITSHSDIVGDFNSAYTVTTVSQTKTE